MPNQTPSLSYHDTLAVLQAALFTPGYNGAWGLPMLVEGEPGTGKSAAYRAMAAACNLQFKALIGAIHDPADFGGYPGPDPDRPKFARALLPNWLADVDTWNGGVLLLDELTTVPLAVQAAMLALLLDRAVADYRLHPRLRPMAACNPVECAVAGTELAAPTANRLLHLRWQTPDLAVWESVLDQTPPPPIDALALEKRVMTVWDGVYAKARILVAGFLRRMPELLQKMPPAGDEAQSGPWPSLRTWEFAARAWASSEIHGLTEEQRDGFLASAVGLPAAVAFAAWVRDADLPDADAVLTGAVDWQPNPARPDRTQAVYGLLAHALRQDAAERPQFAASETGLAKGRVFWRLVQAAADCPDLARDAVQKIGLLDTGINALPEALAGRRVLIGLAKALQLGGLKAS